MFVQELLRSLTEMPGKFIEVGLHDPVSALLLVFATLILGLSLGLFGVLTLGAVVDLLRPSPDESPSRPGR